jgi:pyruvate formate lyase activating enzyme
VRDRINGLGGWLKNSFIDFPGTVSTVLFFSGCNLRCPYCHNPELAEGRENIAERSDEVWAFLEKRRGLIEGVVLSGGEPTLHTQILEIIPEIRQLGYRIKLDTNGLRPDMIENAAPDYLALDIKTLPRYYGEYLDCSCKDITTRLEQSIELVRRAGLNAEIRITIAPEIVDRERMREIAKLVSGVSTVYLQPLNQRVPLLDPSYNTAPDVSDEELLAYRGIFEEAGIVCRVRNREEGRGR